MASLLMDVNLEVSYVKTTSLNCFGEKTYFPYKKVECVSLARRLIIAAYQGLIEAVNSSSLSSNLV